MLTTSVPPMNEDEIEDGLEQPVRPQAGGRTALRWLAVVAAVAAMTVGILYLRGWRPGSDDSSGGTTMPVSAAIESQFGIRFTSVGITAGGGMIELRYQVLDSIKTQVVHDAETAPFVVRSDGRKFADPGMQGHSHIGKAKAPGTYDYILLANSQNGLQPGDHVTIKVGTLELRNVPVV
jgi:hypothetical protein